MTLPIITRAAWGARRPAGSAPAPLPADEVWLHHSAGTTPRPTASLHLDRVAVRLLEEIGHARFRAGISYTFVVAPSGRVFEGHGVARRGAHTRGHNTSGRAICLLGDYTDVDPSPQQVAAVAALLRHGHREGWWRTPRLAGGHRDVPGAATECPGDRAHPLIAEINRLAGPTPAPRPPAPPDPTGRPAQEDDPMAPIPIDTHPVDMSFHVAALCEAGAGSAVAAAAWLTLASTWGMTRFHVHALAADGAVLAHWPGVDVPNNRQWAQRLPDGARIVTLEGYAEHADTRPAAALWHHPAGAA